MPETVIVHPLLAFDDFGGNGVNFFLSLKRTNWARYFGDVIEI